MKNRKNLKGFTLIEILIVIGLIAILAAITIIALNPTENFQQARNASRRSDMTAIAGALNRWVIDDVVNNDITDLGDNDTGAAIPTCNGNYDNGHLITRTDNNAAGNISLSFLVPNYMGEIPTGTATAPLTEYEICLIGTNGSFALHSNNAEGGETINVIR